MGVAGAVDEAAQAFQVPDDVLVRLLHIPGKSSQRSAHPSSKSLPHDKACGSVLLCTLPPIGKPQLAQPTHVKCNLFTALKQLGYSCARGNSF